MKHLILLVTASGIYEDTGQKPPQPSLLRPSRLLAEIAEEKRRDKREGLIMFLVCVTIILLLFLLFFIISAAYQHTCQIIQ